MANYCYKNLHEQKFTNRGYTFGGFFLSDKEQLEFKKKQDPEEPC